MDIVIGLVIGLVIAAIAGYFAYRTGRNKSQDEGAILRAEAQKTLEEAQTKARQHLVEAKDEKLRLQRNVVTSSRRAFELSERQLRAGTADIVTVLNTQLTLFQAEDSLAQAQLARLQAIVSLYQALGGGWSPRTVEAVDAL